MSRAEKYAWASLVAIGAVFWWFQTKLLDGWTIVDQPAGALLRVYFAVIVAMTVFEILIAAVLSIGKTVAKDERDHAIEARASLHERLFIIAAINVLVWQALWEGVLEDHALPKIDLTNLPTLFFFLFLVLFAGEAVKRASTIALYRMQSMRN